MWINAGESVHQGVETGCLTRQSIWSTPISALPPPWGLDIRFGLQGVSEQFSDKENTVAEDADGQKGIIPGYVVYNVSANYEVVKNLKLYLNGYNLSNKKYIASRVDGIHPGQGFQMMGGFKWTF